MAESLMDASDATEPGVGHNQGEATSLSQQKKIISECAGLMNKIIEQRKASNEAAADIRERLRDASINTKAFEAALKVYNMEPDARSAYTDALRMNYAGMGIGGQIDFLGPMQDEVDASQPGNEPDVRADDFEEDPPPDNNPTPEEAAAPA